MSLSGYVPPQTAPRVAMPAATTTATIPHSSTSPPDLSIAAKSAIDKLLSAFQKPPPSTKDLNRPQLPHTPPPPNRSASVSSTSSSSSPSLSALGTVGGTPERHDALSMACPETPTVPGAKPSQEAEEPKSLPPHQQLISDDEKADRMRLMGIIRGLQSKTQTQVE